MELIDLLHQIMQESVKAAKLTDLAIGTVASTSPLSITVNTAMAPLQAPVLYLTDSVVEKTLTASDGTLSGTVNGQPMEATGSTVTLNSALEVGDKVLMLKVQRGQKYIVLSRVYQEG